MKKLLYWTCYALLVSLIFSCSPQKRINRIVKNHPELLVKDTIIYEDTITMITQKVKHDTITSLSSITKDTLIITKDNMTIKTHYNYETDSIYVFGQCDTIVMTEVIREKIPVDKVKVIDHELTWRDYLTYIMIGAVIASFIFILIQLLIRVYPPRI